ncbi:glycosyltransferase family 4 protein [Arsenicicoccus bolidensis]|uniref:D-inositol 3-phosphate glycosyltransferase n=1 Tax=Arsenicicoccus bolidensis TaxID=229480 RepID=A0ABS9Q2B1_9MICO|nr:glycosyltransferase family 4 protein [Arsenicicoccus bolidensis]MCG7322023.1 glycosyltransferase family 4 protein [Arsenicicoccus bolidensis]
MRVGFITQWFPPEPGTLVAQDIAQGLASRGHEVHVVTGFPNYPTGRIMPGYRVRPYQQDHPWPGVTVHRAPLVPSHDSHAVPRMVNYLSFAVGATAVVGARVPRPDAWLVYSSPATAALPALTVPTKQAPVTLLIQDLWPDSVTSSSFLSPRAAQFAERALAPACSAAYRRAAAIGVISPGMRTILESRGVSSDKIHLTPNWVSDGHLLPDSQPVHINRGNLGLPEGLLFVYAGNLGDLQGLDAVVDAFASVPEVQLALVGDGVARVRLEERARRAGTANITFVPQQAGDRIGAYLAAADVQLVSLKDTALLRVTMPSKVQTALASRRPILACVAGDAAALVREAGAGVTAPPGDVEAMAAAIRHIHSLSRESLSAMGDAARQTYLKHYAPAVGIDRLASVLETATTQGCTA